MERFVEDFLGEDGFCYSSGMGAGEEGLGGVRS